MELHQKLTILGVILLAITLIIHTNHSGDGFNYAYVTGIIMLVVFSAGFLLFNKDKLMDSKK